MAWIPHYGTQRQGCPWTRSDTTRNRVRQLALRIRQSNRCRQSTDKGPAAIPVTVQSVQNSDFPVYLNGLGTVQPYNTVTVRSRVDGQVIKVGFRQGQMVNEGDLLVQIDPRPFQAALEQSQAKKPRTKPI